MKASLHGGAKIGLPQRKLRKTGPDGGRWLPAYAPLEAQDFPEGQTRHRAEPSS